jgi:tRNA 2-thiouridine synthesizing protein A
MTEILIDGRGMTCAMLTAKIWKALRGIGTGDIARIIATNPGSLRDVPAQIKNLGLEIVRQETISSSTGSGDETEYHYYVRRLS